MLFYKKDKILKLANWNAWNNLISVKQQTQILPLFPEEIVRVSMIIRLITGTA